MRLGPIAAVALLLAPAAAFPIAAASPVDQNVDLKLVLVVAASKFSATAIASDRTTIDISGDGSNNDGPPLAPIRAQVLAQGITINGLPILINPSVVPGGIGLTGIDDYYRDCVIGGPASFVIPIKTLNDFEPAIRRKLILEIAWQPQQAGIVPVIDTLGAPPKVDCAAADRATFTYVPQRSPLTLKAATVAILTMSESRAAYADDLDRLVEADQQRADHGRAAELREVGVTFRPPWPAMAPGVAMP